LERIECTEEKLEQLVNLKDPKALDLRLWASYRGQTLARTGMVMLH
jgi:hypothetical protein